MYYYSILAVVWKKEAQCYLLLATVGHYSLTPLLFTPMEIFLKALIILSHSVYAFLQLHQMFDVRSDKKLKLPLLSRLETIYILGLVPLFLYEHLIHRFMWFSNDLPFLPLMLTSVYCALGISYTWCKYYWHFLSMGEGNHKRKVH
jgi:alpha-1,3-glucosyltransferase